MRRDQINELRKTNLDELIEVRDSGLYDVVNKNVTYNNKSINSLLDNKFNQSETYLEIKNTKTISVQIIHTSTYDIRRTGIKNNYKYKWSGWCKSLETSTENLDSLSELKNATNVYTYDEVKEVLKRHIKSIKGASYIDMDKGKQPAYNDIAVKESISRLVNKDRRTELVPHNAETTEADVRDNFWKSRENLVPPNRDWLNVGRIENWDNGYIIADRYLHYTYNGNPDDLWCMMRADTDAFHILGHDRFDRIYLEGWFRPKVTQTDGGCFAGNHNTRGNCFMIQEDLNWKWVYNGGRTGFVHVNPTVCNEVYYKCSPDFGIGWPSSYTESGTHGIPQNGGDWTRWNFWDNQERNFGVWGINIENVLYR